MSYLIEETENGWENQREWVVGSVMSYTSGYSLPPEAFYGLSAFIQQNHPEAYKVVTKNVIANKVFGQIQYQAWTEMFFQVRQVLPRDVPLFLLTTAMCCAGRRA